MRPWGFKQRPATQQLLSGVGYHLRWCRCRTQTCYGCPAAVQALKARSERRAEIEASLRRAGNAQQLMVPVAARRTRAEASKVCFCVHLLQPLR